ncbi:MAG: hypothetical protein ABW178_11365 [Pseudoxanthomonas sp.]
MDELTRLLLILACALSLAALTAALVALATIRRLEKKFERFDDVSKRFWDTSIWNHARIEALMKGEPLPSHPRSQRPDQPQPHARAWFSRPD